LSVRLFEAVLSQTSGRQRRGKKTYGAGYRRSKIENEQSSLCSCKMHSICFVICVSAGAVVGIVVAVVAAGLTLLWGEQVG